ncbi:MAG: Na+:solute symporter [Planctomycetaceae bacterium]|nr:Na+:solute symporter [Planctomycetaceae bacterium]
MQLQWLDWAIVFTFFGFSLVAGILAARRGIDSSKDFFLSGRNQPWWLLGTSMVATTFAADTPLLVTSIVREQGVAGNWVWWAFLLTGMLTVAVYAKLWRRSGVVTDVEFYELRYGGTPAAVLRGFRAVYLGLVFNVLVMANVTLAAIKIGQVMFGFTPLQTILIAATVTVAFSAVGGLTSVLITDFVMFIVAMAGAIGAAYVLVNQPEVGGLAGLWSHAAVQERMSIWPILDFSTTAGLNAAATILIIPLAVQWWAAWYPGAEPGGGGYVAQRMLAAKDERHATGATLLFNAAHYAVRPWPWILVGLASLVIFPNLESLQTQLPNVDPNLVRDDLAYPAMMQRLPMGLLGLVTTSLIAAYMSTLSTHLNWGSSYIVNDLWLRFLRPHASQRELLLVGRTTTVVLMVLAAIVALALESVYDGFMVLLKVGAGTGLLYILRWFWWRINAYAEIVAMAVSFLVSALLFYVGRVYPDSALPEWQQFLIIVGLTTSCWMAAAFLLPSEAPATLRRFYQQVQPGGPGWSQIVESAHREGELTDCHLRWNLPREIAFVIAGCVAIYSGLFATGFLLYGQWSTAAGTLLSAFLAMGAMKWLWPSVVGRP